MKALGLLMMCILMQLFISMILELKGVSSSDAVWWLLVLGGGLTFNTGFLLATGE